MVISEELEELGCNNGRHMGNKLLIKLREG